MAKAKPGSKAGDKSPKTSAKPKAKPALKDPKGGLTAAGRAAFKAKDGSNLKPGVTKSLKDMTPQEIQRKGSFLRRHFATLRGPLVGEDGKPTRLALQAHAWGEPVPKTEEAAQKLADKGTRLLEQYKKSQEKADTPTKPKASAPSSPAAKPKAAAPKGKKPAKAEGKEKTPGKKPATRSPRARPQAKAKPEEGSGGSPYTDPALRDKIKAEIMEGDQGGKPGQWSARKSQLLAAQYKKAGGGYTKGKGKKTEAQTDLDQWTDEKWTTKDGQPAVRDGETARYLPEKAWEELTPAEREATDRKKKEASREGTQFVANTRTARKARKSTTS